MNGLRIRVENNELKMNEIYLLKLINEKEWDGYFVKYKKDFSEIVFSKPDPEMIKIQEKLTSFNQSSESTDTK